MDGQPSGARMRRARLVAAFSFRRSFPISERRSGISLQYPMTGSGKKKQYHIYPMADRTDGISRSALRAWNVNVGIGHIE